MSAKDYGIVAICGVLGIAIYNVLLNSGQTTVSAGAASEHGACPCAGAEIAQIAIARRPGGRITVVSS